MRVTRRSFVAGAAVLAGTAYAAPLLELVPETPVLTPGLIRSIYPPVVTPFDSGSWLWTMHPAQYEAFRNFHPEAIDARGYVVLDALCPPDRAYRVNERERRGIA